MPEKAPSTDASVSDPPPEYPEVQVEEPARCDVCGELADEDDEDAESPFSVSGRGLYLWIRGGEVVYEEPPLCARCGTAIGMSALARWEIEEEEG